MNPFKRILLVPALLLGTIISCNDDDSQITKKETGKVRFNISAITIDASPAGGRTKAVSTDDFIVKIFRVGETDPVLVFDPWSDAPDEIELETGEYYAEAQNLDPPADAAFEQPWYYGKSDVFNIDKEELKTIEINCTLANCKVSFVYSQNVLDDFTDWTATTTIIDGGEHLDWPKGEEREGYFITSPLRIDVHLEYTKVFTGELIVRDFNTTINNPQPATHYRINVDAALEDGKIVIVINVDDSFETIDIELGDNTGNLLPGSQILTDPDDVQKIIGWLDPSFHYQAELLFTKELGDGKTSTNFHNVCDNIPNTLSIIKTTDGFVLGGYNEGTWEASINGYTGGLLDNFIFSINNNTKWVHRLNGLNNFEPYSIYSSSALGPTFGGGHDIYVPANLENGNNREYTYYKAGTNPETSPTLYQNHTGFNGPSPSWIIQTLEVWKLNTSGNPI